MSSCGRFFSGFVDVQQGWVGRWFLLTASGVRPTELRTEPPQTLVRRSFRCCVGVCPKDLGRLLLPPSVGGSVSSCRMVRRSGSPWMSGCPALPRDLVQVQLPGRGVRQFPRRPGTVRFWSSWWCWGRGPRPRCAEPGSGAGRIVDFFLPGNSRPHLVSGFPQTRRELQACSQQTVARIRAHSCREHRAAVDEERDHSVLFRIFFQSRLWGWGPANLASPSLCFPVCFGSLVGKGCSGVGPRLLTCSVHWGQSGLEVCREASSQKSVPVNGQRGSEPLCLSDFLGRIVMGPRGRLDRCLAELGPGSRALGRGCESC